MVSSRWGLVTVQFAGRRLDAERVYGLEIRKPVTQGYHWNEAENFRLASFGPTHPIEKLASDPKEAQTHLYENPVKYPT